MKQNTSTSSTPIHQIKQTFTSATINQTTNFNMIDNHDDKLPDIAKTNGKEPDNKQNDQP